MGAMNQRTALAGAAALGATGVALGAFGAHGLQAALGAAGRKELWDTASRYQILHAAALLALASWIRAGGGAASRWEAWAARLWLAGTVLFSGSLYLLALGVPPRWIWPVTPIGGAGLIAGWIAAAAGAAAR
jgi:uncharacterized membrane protein YgdD (TMEM256/DUF423 family)